MLVEIISIVLKELYQNPALLVPIIMYSKTLIPTFNRNHLVKFYSISKLHSVHRHTDSINVQELDFLFSQVDSEWKSTHFENKAYQTLREQVIVKYLQTDDHQTTIPQELVDMVSNNSTNNV